MKRRWTTPPARPGSALPRRLAGRHGAELVVLLALGVSLSACATASTSSGRPTASPTLASPTGTGHTSGPAGHHPLKTTPRHSRVASTAVTGPPNDPDTNSTSHPLRARSVLVDRTRFPGFDRGWRWTSATTETGPVAAAAGDTQASLCMQGTLTAIGGVAEYQRTYHSTASPDAVAYEISAVFPDEQTATTATAVLDSWQHRCRAHVRAAGRHHVAVTPPATTSTPAGPGTSWLVTYRPVAGDPTSSWFDEEGFVRDADVLTYVVVRGTRRAYDYPPGRTPVDQALVVTGRALKRSR